MFGFIERLINWYLVRQERKRHEWEIELINLNKRIVKNKLEYLEWRSARHLSNNPNMIAHRRQVLDDLDQMIVIQTHRQEWLMKKLGRNKKSGRPLRVHS
jgi:hypothetical protein